MLKSFFGKPAVVLNPVKGKPAPKAVVAVPPPPPSAVEPDDVMVEDEDANDAASDPYTNPLTGTSAAKPAPVESAPVESADDKPADDESADDEPSAPAEPPTAAPPVRKSAPAEDKPVAAQKPQKPKKGPKKKPAGKAPKKTKKSKHRPSSGMDTPWASYIRRIIRKQALTPGMEGLCVSRKTQRVVNNMVDDIINSIMTQAQQLCESMRRSTLLEADILAAVRLVMPVELAKYATAHAIQARAVFDQNKAHAGHAK